MKKPKILFFGAGVLGSLYAARLHEAGVDVTLVARGRRYQELVDHGVVLEHFVTGERSSTQVKIVEGMPREEYFDVCIVLIQGTQLDRALPVLHSNSRIPNYMFMCNVVLGLQPIIDILGESRVSLGHVNAGGERVGGVVKYMVSQEMTFGELDGHKSERLETVAKDFRQAGFPVVFSRNIDSWKKYHMALALPLAYALYAAGTSNYQLARQRELCRMCIQGIRENFAVLKALGYPVEPPKLGYVMAIPNLLLVPLFQRLMNTKLADIGMARHCANARAEMEGLATEFDQLIAKSDIPTPSLDALRKQAN